MVTLEDLKLTWVVKNAGMAHYCHDENGKIVGHIHESYSGLFTVYIKDLAHSKIYNEYINLFRAKAALESKLLFDENMITSLWGA